MFSQIKTFLHLLLADSPSRGYLLRCYLAIPATWMAVILLRWVYSLRPDLIPRLTQPIFIIGCSRSGTTILARLFAKHSHLANWSEAPHIFDTRYYQREIDHVWTKRCGTATDAIRIKGLFGLYTWLRGKPRFVNKHPQNSLRMGYLLGLFPDARFIHIVRDGRAVIRSNLQKTANDRYRADFPFGNFPKPPNWRNYLDLAPPLQFAYQWKEVLEHVQAASRACAADQFIEIRYEDLCADVHGTLRRLDEFCQLPPNERDYTHIPCTLSSRNYKWEDMMDAAQLLQIEQVIGPQLQHYGYPTHTDLLHMPVPPTSILGPTDGVSDGVSDGAVDTRAGRSAIALACQRENHEAARHRKPPSPLRP